MVANQKNLKILEKMAFLKYSASFVSYPKLYEALHTLKITVSYYLCIVMLKKNIKVNMNMITKNYHCLLVTIHAILWQLKHDSVCSWVGWKYLIEIKMIWRMLPSFRYWNLAFHKTNIFTVTNPFVLLAQRFLNNSIHNIKIYTMQVSLDHCLLNHFIE